MTSKSTVRIFLLLLASILASFIFFKFTTLSHPNFPPTTSSDSSNVNLALSTQTPIDTFSITHPGYSLMVPTYQRVAVLASFLQTYAVNPCHSLHAIYIIWADTTTPPPEYLTSKKYKIPVIFIIAPSPSLNERFRLPASLNTTAILSMDDDLRLRCSDLETGYRTWRQTPDRIVGYLPRLHLADENGWRYGGTKGAREYSMIMTNVAFLHSHWCHEYWGDHFVVKAMRDEVDRARNCEDLAMNYLVASKIEKPPVLVWSLYRKFAHSGKGLSGSPAHVSKRDRCMKLFAEVLGRQPLENTRSDLMVKVMEPVDDSRVTQDD
ncbi:hypothetical protein HK096_007301 [Nowakowskiella sp. JEL0078]|nr:hypothetical protein HK096_007301 [Nowakowskiella sp. JEL0078]